MNVQLYNDDCLNALKKMEDNSIDSCVTDPPYGLSFMGKSWDYDVPKAEIWKEVLRVMKPGGHILAFFGSRTYHRGVVQIEDAGFEVRDQIMWLYGSGFPKSHNIGNGWGTALKPAHEPIVVARKPITQTVAKNVLEYGTGALNIDGCRVQFQSDEDKNAAKPQGKATSRIGQLAGKDNSYVIRNDDDLYWSNNDGWVDRERATVFYEDENLIDPVGAIRREPATERNTFHFNQNIGRWPANVIHDGSDEVVKNFPQTGKSTGGRSNQTTSDKYGTYANEWTNKDPGYGDSGSAARFFYCAKASKADRDENNNHPTVKPTELMRYLCRLVTPKNGIVLDPFMGSGSTGKAALLEGFRFVGIEMNEEYFEIAKARVEAADNNKVSSLENFFTE
jgi:site-specific DNA-methyltransferase (adenine-specific)